MNNHLRRSVESIGAQVTNSQIICVLGMHRSGTSLAAKILNLLGVHLGPEERLMRPGPSNPKGFWEYKPIVKLNDQILSKRGGNWEKPPDFAEGWENASEFDNLKQRARALIQRDFADTQVWGWKDPRNCLTLPFWQQVLPSMRYVICFRSPVDVARSLERRNGFSPEKGFYLWLTYVKLALKHTEGHPRIFVFYEDILDNWQQEFQRLSEFVGTPERVEQADVQKAVQDFIDEKLRHHRTSIIDTVTQSGPEFQNRMVAIAQQLYVNRKQSVLVQQNDIDQMLREAIDSILPTIREQQQQALHSWMQQLRLATEEISALIPPEEVFILVGEHQWASGETVLRRRYVPFIEKDGHYWGAPPDTATAIEELERLRKLEANFIVFRQPAFWWLDYYSGLREYLRSHFRCMLENDRLVIFDLRPGKESKDPR
jgi:hypothetical protein